MTFFITIGVKRNSMKVVMPMFIPELPIKMQKKLHTSLNLKKISSSNICGEQQLRHRATKKVLLSLL